MGNINIVLGNPGVGKSHTVIYLIINAIRYGFTVYSNIPMINKRNMEQAKNEGYLKPNINYVEIPDQYHYIPLCSDLLIQASHGWNNIVVIDEASITAPSNKAQSNTAVQLKFLAFSIRKIMACLVNIAQDESSVVPTLRANIVKYKVNVKRDDRTDRRDLEFLIGNSRFNQEKGANETKFVRYDYVQDVPEVNIPYDHLHHGGFMFDLNLEKLYRQIAYLSYVNKWDSIDIRNHINEIVKDMVLEYQLEEYQKQKHFMQMGTVADLFNVTTETIRTWFDSKKLDGIKTEKGHRLIKKSSVKKLLIERNLRVPLQ